MSRRIDFWGSVCNVIGGLFGVLGYLFRFVRLMLLPRASASRSLHRSRALQIATSSRFAAPAPRNARRASKIMEATMEATNSIHGRTRTNTGEHQDRGNAAWE